MAFTLDTSGIILWSGSLIELRDAPDHLDYRIAKREMVRTEQWAIFEKMESAFIRQLAKAGYNGVIRYEIIPKVGSRSPQTVYMGQGIPVTLHKPNYRR